MIFEKPFPMTPNQANVDLFFAFNLQIQILPPVLTRASLMLLCMQRYWKELIKEKNNASAETSESLVGGPSSRISPELLNICTHVI